MSVLQALIRKIPFAKSLKRRARAVLAQSPRKSPVETPPPVRPAPDPSQQIECVECRRRDTSREERRILEVVRNAAAKAGETLWTLPDAGGMRFAVAQAPGSAWLDELAALCAANDISFRLTSRPLESNLYEFDQVEMLSPTEAHVVLLSPAPHCKAGKSYLEKRALRLELVEQRDGVLVVPVPGRGPRIIGAERAPHYEVRGPAADVIGDWPFPIDLVYAWVDTDDDIWRKNYASVSHEIGGYGSLKAATNPSRWHSRDELRYSLRSVEMYAPFVRNIFVVTNGQVPRWLATNDKVRVVRHAELYPDPDVLPTFNSNHIESVLHNIEGLAEHFLYLNDDFFFSRRTTPEDFFTIGGLGKVFYSARHLDDRPVTEHDRATVAAHKNSRDLLERRFGVACHRKFLHAPYVMRRSVWREIESDFGADLAACRTNRFRSRTDINGQFLYAHYAVLAGRALPATIPCGYYDIQEHDIAGALTEARKAKVKVFCLNDTDSTTDNVAAKDLEIRVNLALRFPTPGHWEDPAFRYPDQQQ